MRVTTTEIEDAVLQIFLCNDVPVSGSLLMIDLRQEWPKSHLRYEDLSTGIRSLAQGGFLNIFREPADDRIQLSQKGYRRCTSLPPLPSAIWQFAYGVALKFLRQGEGQPAANARERRREAALHAH